MKSLVNKKKEELKEHRKEKQKFEKENSYFSGQNIRLDIETQKMIEQLKVLKNSFLEVTNELRYLEFAANQSAYINYSYKNELAAENIKIFNLEQLYFQKESIISSNMFRIQELNNNKLNLQATLKTIGSTINQLKEELSEQAEKISKLQQPIESNLLMNTLDQANKKISELEEKNMLARKKIYDFELYHVQLNAKLVQTEENLKEKELKKTDLESQCNRLVCSIEQISSENGRLQQEIKIISRKTNDLKEQNGELLNKIKQDKSKRTELEERLKRLQDKAESRSKSIKIAEIKEKKELNLDSVSKETQNNSKRRAVNSTGMWHRKNSDKDKVASLNPAAHPESLAVEKNGLKNK